jgi:hypothetical protein
VANTSECLKRAKIYSDDATVTGLACLKNACGGLNRCVQATLDAADGDWGVGGGIDTIKFCVGEAPECHNFTFSVDTCEDIIGCSGSARCDGNVACSTLDAFYCPKEPGCTWKASADPPCSGKATPCSGRDQATCGLVCNWIVTCSGSVVQCSKLGPADCGKQYNCMLR